MRQPNRWIRGGLAAALLWVGASVGVQAQESSRGGVILHEYFEPGGIDPAGSEGSASVRGEPDRTARSAEEPPGLTLNARGGDRVLGSEGPVDSGARQPPYGPPSPRSGPASLDDQTDRVDDLDYHANFDPSVFPYKRNVAQNRAYRSAGGEYRFETAPGEIRRVRVGGSVRSSEDVFWGSFLVRASAGAKHPIPSVAPGQRILEVRTEPETQVRVMRDAAGNFYAQIDYDGLIRLNMKVAADRYYFRGRFEGSVSWADFAAYEQPELDPEVRAVARRVAAEIGVDRQMDPGPVVRRLVEHYRNFETRELAESERGEDLYETISKRQVGVCRHRSMGFVLTARHLGIPARYVTNEAHAFVEVWWPEEGWRRIDLGGAAREISYNGEREDRLHDGAQRDPLPRPPKYREEMREADRPEVDGERSGTADAGERSGGSEGRESTASRGGSQTSRPDAGRAGSAGAGSPPVNSGNSSDSIDAGRSTDPAGEASGAAGRRAAEAEAERGAERSAEPENQSSRPSGPEEGGRVPTELTLRTDSKTVFRGAAIEVSGRLQSASGEALQEASVEIYFGRVGAPTGQMERIGTARTGAGGEYRVEVTVPETTGIGRWSLVAFFPGNGRFAEARSE